MDLIYADSNLNDLGVLKSYDIDLAFGSDENNFELKTPISNNVLEIGMYIYYPGTGYGGIIDAKKVSRVNNNIVLSGRTLEGILEGAVISPDAGAAYYAATGDANAIIKALITRCNLGFLFRGSDAEIGQISNYLFRYDKMYTGIIKMLNSADLTLAIKGVAGANNKTIFEISAVPIKDYSTDEEWTSDQIKVESGIYGNQTNHLLCLGGGNLAERHVIHLFCDANGNVQPYKLVENPLSDSDYILDQTKKVYNGISEIVEVYDYPSIASIDNFVLLTEQPEDWAKQELFYTKDGDAWAQVDYAIENQYQEIAAQPSNWATAFKNYYHVVNGAYTNITAEEAHTLLAAQPSDWATNYGSYYTRYSDGVTVTWPSVKPATAERLELQTMEPTDWATNWAVYRTSNWQSAQGVEYQRLQRGINVIVNSAGQLIFAYAKTNGTIYNDYNIYYSPKITLKHGFFTKESLDNIYASLDGATSITIYGSAAMTEYQLQDFIQKIRTANIYLGNLGRSYNEYINSQGNEMAYFRYTQDVERYQSECADFMSLAQSLRIHLYYVMDNNTLEIAINPNELNIDAYMPYIGAPVWQTNTYYTAIKYDVAPAWANNTYYRLDMVAPAWVTGKYFKLISIKVANEFVTGKYYRKLTDNYYNLVEAGIKKLAEMRKANTITAKLNARREYGLGDIVAVRETITNTTANMSVSKKILSGTNGNLTISYTLE